MEVGINFFPDVDHRVKPAERYFAECLDLVELADGLGYHHVRIVEHYFHQYGGYSPNPIVFLAAAAARSRNLKLITGAVLPAFNHPLKLAGEIGMLDAVSGGRLEVGFARAFLPHEFQRFGVDMDTSRARFDEGVDAVRRLLTEEDVAVAGRFHSFPATTSLPRPTQRPHPPLWVAALSSEHSFRSAGELGCGIMAIPLAADAMRRNLEVYREAWQAAGHPGRGRVMLAFHMHCAPDRELARARAEEPVNAYLRSLAAAASDWTSGVSSADYPGYRQMIEKLAADDFHSVLARSAALVGTPDDIVDQVREFHDRCGGFEVASLQVNFSTLDPVLARESVVLFGEKALPRLRADVPGAVRGVGMTDSASVARDYQRSLQRSRDSRGRRDRPAEFRLADRDWALFDEVFPPVYSASTEVFLNLLDLPRGGSMLEIGCGAGVIAVSAALAGCAQVVATDVNPHAVRNTESNAARHGVAGRVRCQESDMFAALPPRETFDLVFWHSNFVLAPETLTRLTLHDLAYVDPGYRAHRAFLREALDRVRPGGSALLGFSSRGDVELLRRLAGDAGVALGPVAAREVRERDHAVEYRLLRLSRGAGTAGGGAG
ncbi:LLM class flavin-dependent oxidoreductase [Streptomyces sp. B1866]|uniref:LLM class flavin-dependent oxidoreductase n=1 Tax=Streptomyces sp. B1866 TaxID=3075431 RepID=UPI00288F72E9|nr:LLM class flavin-dependent oxidoreductase [Streptomyces sp. B1866]MDT3399799.1 LLM class flavin-dependent oxidoreductase [Streptomyces sp. B1866]